MAASRASVPRGGSDRASQNYASSNTVPAPIPAKISSHSQHHIPPQKCPLQRRGAQAVKTIMLFPSLGTKGGSSGKPSNRWRRNFSLAKWKVRAGRGTKQNAAGISSLHPTVLLHVKIKPWVTTVKGRADHRNTGLFFSPVH